MVSGTEPAPGVGLPGLALPGNRWDVLDGVWPTEPPSVSVIVAHFEQQAELDRCLAALARQEYPAEAVQVIVVDDGSRVPPTVPPGVELVVQADLGFRLAAARNAGVAKATGRILCFLDADTVPEPSYLGELTRLPALAPDVVTVGRRRHADLASLPADAPVEAAAPAVELPSPAWLVDAYQRSHDLLDADDRSYRFVIGAVVACDAARFAEWGGFDETFTEYGGEDWEWAYRAWLGGAVLAHVPRAVAWHDGPEWAGRPESALSRKNAEAIRLARRIPVPGSGPRGLRGECADVVVTLPEGADESSPAWFVTLDSMAAELPTASTAGDGRSGRLARILVDVLRPLRVTAVDGARGLGELVDRVGRDGLGSATVRGADGEALCVVRARRAVERARLWGRNDLFESISVTVPGIDALPAEVDVEAYLGGWG